VNHQQKRSRVRLRQTFSAGFRIFMSGLNSSGFLILAATLISILITNTSAGESYAHFWHHELGIRLGSISAAMPLSHFINDALMAVFFLLVGLEIKREILAGELSDPKTASLPVVAALGGMLMPAAFYALLNLGSETASGWGIPMATDIAFALAVMVALGDRVPLSLKVMLTSLAVVDDLGAIVVIAVFYSSGLSWMWLGAAAVVFSVMLMLNRLKVKTLWMFLFPAILLWYCVLQSGVHATIAGVMAAIAIPYRNGNEDSPLLALEHALLWPVNFLILPLFALSNTAIHLDASALYELWSPLAAGISSGLILGKPIGIVSAVLLSARLGWIRIPDNISHRQLWGMGILGGIGFTMSIFVSMLAFNEPAHIESAKLAILISSALAAVLGYRLLLSASKN
jgi:NhaA family Na+:H+ antiporter